MSLTDFLEKVSIPLKLIDKRIDEKKHQTFLTKERTGQRTVDIEPKLPAPPLAA